MDNEIAIKIDNISKIYKLYDKPIDRLKETLNPFRKKYHNDFYALKDVSFEVKKGETLGIIGKNGSGKSTLLKVLTGILTPNSGNVYVNGKISALLELGAGFNIEYTGIENVYLNGMMMGYSRGEISAKMGEILDFADIGDFINQPVKTYSSGMFVRLAFAVAINVDPDILIVDEALSVGDMRFQKKCMEKINEIKESGKTIIFCSHDMHAVNELCDKVIWIREGNLALNGDSTDVISQYVKHMTELNNFTSDSKGQSQNPNYYVRNSEIIEITEVKTYDSEWNLCNDFFDGEDINCEVTFIAKEYIDKPHFNIAVFRWDKVLSCLTSTTFNKNIDRPSYNVGINKVKFTLKRVPLSRGKYIIGFSIWDNAKKIVFANNIVKEFNINTLKIVFGPTSEKVVFFPQTEWELKFSD